MLMMRYVILQGISKIQLRVEDVMMILETLEFDGRIDRIDNEDGDSFRQAMLAIPETSAFTSIPCGVCPVSLALQSNCTSWLWHLHCHAIVSLRSASTDAGV